MLDLPSLQALLAVHDRGGVIAAAQALGYTPSAVSQQVKRLEREVGVALLERLGRGVVLTPEGRLLVEDGRRLVADAERLGARVAAGGDGPRGTVALAGFATAVRGLVVPCLTDLALTAPQLRLVVAEVEPTTALDQVLAGAVEVALVHTWVGLPLDLPPGTTGVGLGGDRADVLVHRGSPHAGAPVLTPAELLDEAWVQTPPGTVCHAWFLHMFAGQGRMPRVAYRSGEYATHIGLVAAGLATALVPRLGRGDLPGDVVAVQVRDPEPQRDVRIVVRDSLLGDPAVGCVVDALRRTWAQVSAAWS